MGWVIDFLKQSWKNGEMKAEIMKEKSEERRAERKKKKK